MPAKRESALSIFDALHPTASVAVGIVGVVVWVYTTFVTVSALNQQVAELNSRINDRYQQAIDHSDANYAKMSAQMTGLQSMLQEMRDSLRSMQERFYNNEQKKTN